MNRPKDFSKFPEESVKHILEIKRLDLLDYERMASDVRQYIADLEADLYRRAADRFWDAHPGERLEVGDMLHNDGGYFSYRSFNVGDYAVCRINIVEDGSSYPIWVEGTDAGWISIEEARRWKEACNK